MTATLHNLTTPAPDPKGYVAFAVVGHVVLLVLVSLAISHSIHTAPPMMMQVHIVGAPQPSAAPPKVVMPEQVRTQQSAAPKEPPPDAKDLPDSKPTTKLLKAAEPTHPQKQNDINAQKRPPVLDKTPDKKKVVKNKLDAKVVKNPEDYMAALNFIDKLQEKQLAPSPTVHARPQPDKQAGEGEQIQLNVSEQGQVDAIRQQVMDHWIAPIGMDTKGLTVIIRVQTATDGNVIGTQVTQSSGNSAFDNSLLRAVQKAAPLQVPPDDPKFRDIDLSFSSDTQQ
jgi:colicin import membrane protein